MIRMIVWIRSVPFLLFSATLVLLRGTSVSATFVVSSATTSSSTTTAFGISHHHEQQRQRQRLTTTSLFAEADDDASSSSSSSSFADTALHIADAAQELRGEIVVVKYGGNAMTSPALAAGFCQDVAALTKLGINVVVVHGGGPQISNMLKTVGVESRFEGGFRVSSPEVVDVAEMVLCGSVNKQIANGICAAGGTAVGLSGRDANLLQCTKQRGGEFDLGNVGQVQVVNTKLLHDLLHLGLTPVVSPIGTGMDDEATLAYNVNADVAAGRIAGELKAARVLFLTDIAGVLNKEMQLLPQLSVQDIQDLIADGTITGGMIPKVSYATSAIELGVGGAFITDGRVPHALLNQILGTATNSNNRNDDEERTGGTLVTLN